MVGSIIRKYHLRSQDDACDDFDIIDMYLSIDTLKASPATAGVFV